MSLVECSAKDQSVPYGSSASFYFVLFYEFSFTVPLIFGGW